MKTLSAANTANIADRTKTPVRLVRLTGPAFPDGQSAYYSIGDVDGYHPGILSIGAIDWSADPRGGLGAFGDVEIVFALAAIKSILQDDTLNNTGVGIVVKYGSDTEIPVWSGIVDGWDISGGQVTVRCIHESGIKKKSLPLQRVNATEFSTYTIPDANDGKWVPFTIGAPYRPKGILVDHTTPYSGDGARWAFNAPVAGHDAIKAMGADQYWIFDTSSGRYLPSAGSIESGELADGLLGIIYLTNHGNVGIQSQDTLDFVSAEFLTGGSYVNGSNPTNAIDGDIATYAELANPAADGQTKTGVLRLGIPVLSYGGGLQINGIDLEAKVAKVLGLNAGGRTQEIFSFGIELVEDTVPTGGYLAAFMASGTSFDGTKELPIYGAYSIDLGHGHWSWLNPNILSSRWLDIVMTEEDLAGGGDTTDGFLVYKAKLVLYFASAPDVVQVHGDITGYEDDGSGTYTGSANSLIENPADVLRFILAELFGEAVDGTNFATARTDAGTFAVAGQVLELAELETLLADIARQSRMILFRGIDGNWTIRRWNEPGTADKTFEQYQGHFIGDVSVSHTPTDEINTAFDVLYGWDEGHQKFNSTYSIDAASGGSVGTWLTNSETTYGLTRKMVLEANWINDADSAQSLANWLVYRYADRLRMVTLTTGWYGLDVELFDRLALTHTSLDACAVGGSDANLYEPYSIQYDLMTGIITIKAVQATLSHSALTDPT